MTVSSTARRAAAIAAVLLAAGLAMTLTARPVLAAGWCVSSHDTDHEPDSCGPYRYPASRGIAGDIEVDNHVWSDPAGFTNRICRAGRICQTLYARSPGRWHAVADYPAGDTSVRAFPSTYQNVDWVNGREPRLSRWKLLQSTWAERFRAHANPGTIAEAGYDIWLDNWDWEVMIQVDFAGDRQRPRCDRNGDVIATQRFWGQRWDLCKFDSELIWQYPTGVNHSHGRAHILAMLDWLIRRHYLPRNPGLTALSFGFEICSTGGQLERFPLTGFTLTTRRA
jgi:hypothetical protein